VVDVPWVVHGLIDRGSCDLVEHHPFHRHLRLEVLHEMPADRLALAVFVGGEIQLAGVLQRSTEILDNLLAAVGQLIGGPEPVLDVDCESLRREVGDVAYRGAYVERVTEELGDRLCLRRGLDDD
jgi:hypothetical protein